MELTEYIVMALKIIVGLSILNVWLLLASNNQTFKMLKPTIIFNAITIYSVNSMG